MSRRDLLSRICKCIFSMNSMSQERVMVEFSYIFCVCGENAHVLVCSYSILNNLTSINVKTSLYWFFVSLIVSCHICVILFLFFLADDRSSSVPGKVTKASAAAKRSIADSEEKSEAYKSIFTTHSSAKRPKEECSNWVTHTAYCFWNSDEPDCNLSTAFLPWGFLVQLQCRK